MVICLERDADLHMAQLMPLPLTVSCFSKIQIGFTFLVWLTWVVPDKGPWNRCVCMWILNLRRYSSDIFQEWRAGTKKILWHFMMTLKKVKVAHTRLWSIGFRNWSRFLAVSLQVTWVINPVVGCHYFLPGLQLPSKPLRGLLPISLLGEQRHDGCEQFAQDCYPTRLGFEPKPYCAWVQHTNNLAAVPLCVPKIIQISLFLTELSKK